MPGIPTSCLPHLPAVTETPFYYIKSLCVIYQAKVVKVRVKTEITIVIVEAKVGVESKIDLGFVDTDDDDNKVKDETTPVEEAALVLPGIAGAGTAFGFGELLLRASIAETAEILLESAVAAPYGVVYPASRFAPHGTPGL